VIGTPTTSVNGKKVEGVLGPVLSPFVEQSFQRLTEAVEPLLGQNTEVKINLSADAKEGQLMISAVVEGLVEPSENLRLRLVLAEDEIAYVAPNQIRLHEMVVRTMPGGPEGVQPQAGDFKFTQTIKLAEFRQRLADDLATLEENVGEKFPVNLEPEKLHLVAFVQDDSTREVLQAAAIPIAGPLDEGPAAPGTEPEATSGSSDESAKDSASGSSSGPELKRPQANAGTPEAK
jgi:hypothetical protein